MREKQIARENVMLVYLSIGEVEYTYPVNTKATVFPQRQQYSYTGSSIPTQATVSAA